MKCELVIEIRGAAGAGKSLVAAALSEELQVLGFEVDNQDDGPPLPPGHRLKLKFLNLNQVNTTIATKITIATKCCKKDQEAPMASSPTGGVMRNVLWKIPVEWGAEFQDRWLPTESLVAVRWPDFDDNGNFVNSDYKKNIQAYVDAAGKIPVVLYGCWIHRTGQIVSDIERPGFLGA